MDKLELEKCHDLRGSELLCQFSYTMIENKLFKNGYNDFSTN